MNKIFPLSRRSSTDARGQIRNVVEDRALNDRHIFTSAVEDRWLNGRRIFMNAVEDRLLNDRQIFTNAVEDRWLNDGHIFMFGRFRILVSILCVLCVLGVSISAQDWKAIHNGVEYARVDYKIGSEPVRINLLRLDLKKVRLDVHHAFDKAIGVEPTSSIAMRHGAVAAINAGFFRLDKTEFAGDAAGVLVIDKRLFSESKDSRVAVGIINGRSSTEVYFGHPEFGTSVVDDDHTGINITGTNRERLKDDVIVYSPDFGNTTNRKSGGVELVLRRGKVTSISRNGNSPIPKDGFVLSGDGEGADGLIERWKVGSKISYRKVHRTPTYDFGPDIDREQKRVERFLTFDPNILFKLEDVTNGVPQLIKNGNIDITWKEEKTSKSFAEMRHPRTAVAKLKDGKFLMITVDGRQPGVSVGMTLLELAEYILSLGATDAMNLDGGGSTTMYVDGKVLNTPSDKEGERKVSDAILVTLRKRTR